VTNSFDRKYFSGDSRKEWQMDMIYRIKTGPLIANGNHQISEGIRRVGQFHIRTLLCVLFCFFSLALVEGEAGQTSTSSQVRAESLLQQGKPSEAVSLLLQLHESQPQNSQICLQLGIAYTQLEQLEKAADFYRKALRLNPRLMAARKNLATVLWFLNQKEKSVEEFLGILKMAPSDPVPHLYLGSWEYEHQQFARAKAHFEKAGDLAYKNPEALPMVLESYLAVKDMTVPQSLMKQLEKARNPDPELAIRLGTLFSHYGVYDQAIKTFEKILPSSSVKPEVFLLLGEAYDKQGMPEKAYNAFTKAIEIDPKLEEGYSALSSFASDHQNKEFALKILNQGLQKIPGSSKLLLQQGVLWALEGDLLQAQKSFLRACQADPRWVLPILALGISHLQESKSAEAASTFQQAATIAPDDYRPEYFYALALTRAGKQDIPSHREEIISALRKSIVLNPSRPEPHVLLGRTYLAANQVGAAVVELEKALELDPRNPTALYQLGIAYRKQGNSAEGERLLRAFEETKAKLKEEEDQERKALLQILKTVK